ncbi:MAG: acetamidase/formamidase family protein [Caldilineaceae bacterium]
MTRHFLEPTEASLHGYFSVDLPPILTIESGDTVQVRTLDAGWGLEALSLERRPRKRVAPPTDAPLQGHALCGPIAIRGAQPGMTLGVAIETVRPGPWGWTWSGGAHGNPINQRLGTDTGEETLLLWEVDAARNLAQNQLGHRVSLRPFMGILGMPPPTPGAHSTWPPRRWGGNLDCKELVAGSVLYLPIGVEGARFSVGDGHGAQGDGEIGGQAIECPMEQVDLTFTLHTDFPITTPHAQIAAGWLTFGFHEDLDEATVIALNAMLDLMMGRYDCSRKEALGLASIIVDVRVTQIVNGVRGVHAFLPDTTVNEYSVT